MSVNNEKPRRKFRSLPRVRVTFEEKSLPPRFEARLEQTSRQRLSVHTDQIRASLHMGGTYWQEFTVPEVSDATHTYRQTIESTASTRQASSSLVQVSEEAPSSLEQIRALLNQPRDKQFVRYAEQARQEAERAPRVEALLEQNVWKKGPGEGRSRVEIPRRRWLGTEDSTAPIAKKMSRYSGDLLYFPPAPPEVEGPEEVPTMMPVVVEEPAAVEQPAATEEPLTDKPRRWQWRKFFTLPSRSKRQEHPIIEHQEHRIDLDDTIEGGQHVSAGPALADKGSFSAPNSLPRRQGTLHESIYSARLGDDACQHFHMANKYYEGKRRFPHPAPDHMCDACGAAQAGLPKREVCTGPTSVAEPKVEAIGATITQRKDPMMAQRRVSVMEQRSGPQPDRCYTRDDPLPHPSIGTFAQPLGRERELKVENWTVKVQRDTSVAMWRSDSLTLHKARPATPPPPPPPPKDPKRGESSSPGGSLGMSGSSSSSR